ncbi:MAG TPA: glycosyltransferase family 39 protein [Vicinamibacteria bacterium]|nr:glycosyltransferase family 39 protein [Vicinamibacteria bacterium]
MRKSAILLTLVGLVVRVLFAALEPAAQLVGDEHTWRGWALELLTPEVRFDPAASRILFYPPLYPYFLAALHGLTGSWTLVKLAQAALGALLVPAVVRVTAHAMGERAAVAAGVIAAVYPDLVWFSAHFWSETLFLVLLWWGFERLLAAQRSGARAAALAAGLLWGLATLTRETALYFIPLAALWLWEARREVRTAAAYALAAALVILPWTWRNSVVWDAFVPVSTAGGLNLWQGNARMTREEVYAEYAKVPGRVAKYRYAREKGIEAIRERQPEWLLEKLRGEMPRFWEADSLALAHIDRGAYGAVQPSFRRAAGFVFVAPYLALLLPFALGVACIGWSRASGLLLGFLIFHNLLHVATHGFARYRLPILPVVFAFATAALAEARWRRLSPRRLVVAALVAGILGASVAPSLREALPEEEAGPSS